MSGTPASPRPAPGWAGPAAFVGVVLAALVLRLPYAEGRSIWFDESASWRTVSFPVDEMLRRVQANVHPPLYYLLLKGWVAVWGDSALALRSLSILLGAAAVGGVYLVARAVNPRPDSRWFPLVAAALAAASPVQVQASFETKMYALGGALVAFSTWFLVRGLSAGGSRWDWVGYWVTATASAYTHNYCLFSVAAHGVFLAVLAVLGWRRGDPARTRAAVCGMVAAAAVAAAYLPWFLTLRTQVRKVQASYWIEPMKPDAIPTTLYWCLLPAVRAPTDGEVAAAAVLIAAVVAAAARGADVRVAAVLVSFLGPFLFAGLASLYTPIWHPRYFRFAHLFLLVTVAVAIWRIPSRGGRAAAAAVAVALVAGTYVVFWNLLDVLNKNGMRAAVAELRGQLAPGEPVLTVESAHYLPAKFYARDGIDLKLVAPAGGFPHHQGGILLRDSDLTTVAEVLARRPPSFWVISHPSSEIPPELVADYQATNSFFTLYYYFSHSPVVATRYERRQ
jgi:uncharacterized membrane protein